MINSCAMAPTSGWCSFDRDAVASVRPLRVVIK